MGSKKNIPEIRFKGFEGEWKEKKLNEICTYHTSSLSIGDAISDGGYELYDANNVIGYTNSNVQPCDYITIIKDGSGVGRVRLMPKNTSFIGTMGALRSNNSDIHFLLSKLQKTDFTKHITGATIPHVYFSNYGNELCNTPTLPEQTQIGTYFQNLDSLISLHQRKYDKLLTVKKAMLEKMFPKEGADVPEIRFKGFVGKWEKKKLEDICRIGDIDHRMPQTVNEGIPYLMTGDFIGLNNLNFENSKLISLEDYEQLAKKIKPEFGDILFARYASVGAVRYGETRMKFLISYSCAILKPNDKINGRYLFYNLQSSVTQYQIELDINTGSQRNIGIDSLKKLFIQLPTDIEQTKIGTFFQNLDTLITQHQKELEKLKNLKKACLEKMFV